MTTVGNLYRASARTPAIVDVPAMRFLMIDGSGAPGAAAYTDAVGALYPLAYGLRAAVKKAGAVHSVSPLEGLWWADDPAQLATVEAIRRGEGSWSDAERAQWR